MLVLIALAVAPGLALVLYLYRRDRYEKEPPALILATFLAGVVATVPAMLAGLLVTDPLAEVLIGNPAIRARWWEPFVAAGLVEEACKLAAVYLTVYRNPNLNEPYDAVLYSAVGALGFATLENMFYVLEGGVGTGLIRAVLSVPGHALDGIIMGSYLGRARFTPDCARRGRYMALALLVPAFLHGLYDALLEYEFGAAAVGVVVLMAYLWMRGLRVIRETVAASPFRPVLMRFRRSGRRQPAEVCREERELTSPGQGG